nr:SDR family oxidoreductase [Burkholderia sp. Ac-20344]
MGGGGGLHGERAGQGGKCGILAERPVCAAGARCNRGDATDRENGGGSASGPAVIAAPVGQRACRDAGAVGVGLAAAAAAQAKGAGVTLVGRTRAKLESAAQAIGGARIAVADIADRHAVQAVFDTIARVDHLVVAPGFVATPLYDAFGPEARDTILSGAASALPGGRVGRADEVGEAIAFLLGNGFMNGEILHIDGGGRLV